MAATCTLNAPISLGTVDQFVLFAFGWSNLPNPGSAVAHLKFRHRISATGELRGMFDLEVANGQPLKKLRPADPDDYANPTPDNYATQLFLAVKASTGNPDDEILGWLITNGCLDASLP